MTFELDKSNGDVKQFPHTTKSAAISFAKYFGLFVLCAVAVAFTGEDVKFNDLIPLSYLIWPGALILLLFSLLSLRELIQQRGYLRIDQNGFSHRDNLREVSHKWSEVSFVFHYRFRFFDMPKSTVGYRLVASKFKDAETPDGIISALDFGMSVEELLDLMNRHLDNNRR